MPYVSDAQRHRFHAMLKRHEISKKTVDEWYRASKGKKLPEHAKKKGTAEFAHKMHEHAKNKERKR